MSYFFIYLQLHGRHFQTDNKCGSCSNDADEEILWKTIKKTRAGDSFTVEQSQPSVLPKSNEKYNN